MRGENKPTKHCGSKTDQIGTQRKHCKHKREQGSWYNQFGYDGDREDYMYHIRSCLAQKSKESFGSQSANGSSPLERWGGSQRTRRIPSIQTGGPTMASEATNQMLQNMRHGIRGSTARMEWIHAQDLLQSM
eukprot:10699296-Heterocapsa_arctica.AAC.1